MTPSDVYSEAKKRFEINSSRCFQRVVRDIYSELDGREQMRALPGDARVERISKTDAESLVLRYEWLGNIGKGASAFYGLTTGGELLGATVFGIGTGRHAQNICGEKYIPLSVTLMRGCCTHFAPKNAPSFLVRHAVRQAYIDQGWRIFIGYADPHAAEVGIIYQAVGWQYLGQGVGRATGRFHFDWRAPNGTVITSRGIHHRRMSKKELFAQGYVPVPRKPKGKYVWFEGDNREQREQLKSECRYPFMPYPKRTMPIVAQVVAAAAT